MISYKPFWETLEKSNETQYTLIHNHNISGTIIHRLKHNKNLQTDTIAKLCEIFNCDVSDIMEYTTEQGTTLENSEI